MNVQVVGCSHHGTSIVIRERLAFGRQQAEEALQQWRLSFRDVEGVLLSTCNRVEVYAASQSAPIPGVEEIGHFLARFHQLDPSEIVPHLFVNTDEAAVRHLFSVAASLDSMVLGEPQILAQVKQAYQAATEREATGPLLAHGLSGRHPRRPPRDHRNRHPPASREHSQRGRGRLRPADLRALRRQGNARHRGGRNGRRNPPLSPRRRGPADHRRQSEFRAGLPAGARSGKARRGPGRNFTPRWPRPTWSSARRARESPSSPSTTSAPSTPRGDSGRCSSSIWPCRAISIRLIGDRPDVYLYSVDDLQAACQNNRLLRDKELPAAQRIVEQETRRFMAEMYHRATGPVIQQLRDGWHKPKEEELRRLMNRLPNLDQRAQDEIRQSFDRLVNKLLHPPLESLRDESREGVPHGLLDALARLFQLRD